MKGFCAYKNAYGKVPSSCPGICSAGKKHCIFFHTDPIGEAISEWKTRARVDTPIVWKIDREHNTIYVYTSSPKLLIGENEKMLQEGKEYLNIYTKAAEGIELNIEIVKCDGGV